MSADKRFTAVDALPDMIYGLAGSRAASGNLLFTFGCHQYPQITLAGRF